MEKLAENIMTRSLISVKLRDSALHAYKVMKRESIRHLPVFDEDGGVVGLLSDRDLNKAMLPSSAQDDFSGSEPVFDPRVEVKDIMSWPVRFVGADEDVQAVAEILLTDKISSVLVMDTFKRPLGIITTDDMLKLLVRMLAAEPKERKITLDSLMKDFVFKHASV